MENSEKSLEVIKKKNFKEEKSLREKVLEYLKEIPFGKVATYQHIANKFGTHPRAVAVFMRTNKFPEIFPCYKVVSKNGFLSGYSAEGGIETKKKKLEKEGILFNGDFVEKDFIIF